MAAEQLQIQVQANVQQAITGLNTLNTQLGNTSTAANELGAKSLNILNNQLQRLQRIAANPNLSTEQYKRLGDLIKTTSKEADNLSKSLTVLNRSQGQLKTGTGQATYALTNFGRVASDAPFGLIGIANNIDPLIQSFVGLRKETGSTGGALKALGASLTGGGGLILAVSLVTSALQFAQLGFSRWGASAKKAKEDQDKLKQGQEQLIETTTKTRLEFETLVKVAKDTTQTELARNQALKKLNEILPDTIGKLTQQNIATAQGAEIIRNYIKAVEAKATAELLSGRIAANNVKIFDLQQNQLTKIADVNTEIENTTRAIRLAEKNNNLDQELFLRNKLLILQNKSKGIQTETANEINNINKLNETLRAEYEKQIPVVNTLNDKVEKTGKKTDEITELLQKYREEIKGISWDEQQKEISLVDEKIKTASDTLKNLYLKNVKESSSAWKEVNGQLQGFLLDKKFNDFSKVIEKINTQVEDQGGRYKSSQKAFEEANKASLKIADDNLKKILADAVTRDLLDKQAIARQKELGETIAGFVTPAVDSLIDAFASGQDPFEALQQSVKGLIIELTKLIAKQLIYNAISTALNIAAPGAGSAASTALKFRGDFIFTGLSRATSASDRRLKENIIQIGISASGLKIYTFNYIDYPEMIYQGVMAQDLIGTEHEKAVKLMGNFYAVNYSLLDVEFKRVA